MFQSVHALYVLLYSMKAEKPTSLTENRATHDGAELHSCATRDYRTLVNTHSAQPKS